MRSLAKDIGRIIGKVVKGIYIGVIAVFAISLIAYMFKNHVPELYALFTRFYGIFH